MHKLIIIRGAGDSLQTFQELLQREVIVIVVGILSLRKASYIISSEVLGLVYEVRQGVS